MSDHQFDDSKQVARLTNRRDSRPFHGIHAWIVVLVLFNVALAQPLLDLLGDNSEFFVAHGSGRADLLLLAVTLTLLVPSLLAVVPLAASRLHPQWGRAALAGVVTPIIGCLLLLALQVIPPLSIDGRALLAGSMVIGALAGIAIARVDAILQAAVYVAPVPLIVLGLFLFASPASSLVFPERSTAGGEYSVLAPAPVVIVVLDELPASSIMTPSGGLDRQLVPNIARLADDATWYRDATTPHEHTTYAVPALLTGQYPREERLATPEHHPQNLLAVLGQQYDVRAMEVTTQLCPAGLCSEVLNERSTHERFQALARDIRVVLLHRILPPDLRQELPPVNDSWRDFDLEVRTETKPDETEASPREQFHAFIDAIQHADTHQAHFIHVLLPHTPWRYLPGGQDYEQRRPAPGRIDDGPHNQWDDDEFLVNQAYQRHLLQVAFTDHMLGHLLDRMQEVGLYHRALIVIAADHGIAFEPGKPNRHATEQTLAEIASVPLFIKQPEQRDGAIIDRPVELVDVMPTLMELLDVDGSFEFDGNSLLAQETTARVSRKLRRPTAEAADLPPLLDDLKELADSRDRRLGTGVPKVIQAVEHSNLIGLEVSDLDTRVPDPPLHTSVADGARYESWSPDDDPFPALIRARISFNKERHEPAHVAVSLDDHIVAVVRTFNHDRYEGLQGDLHGIVLPEHLSENADNTLGLHLIEGRHLLPLQLRWVEG